MFLGLINMVDENACKIYFESAINISLRDTILLTDVYLFVLSVQHDFQPVSQIL